jgi:hypothetical protein
MAGVIIRPILLFRCNERRLECFRVRVAQTFNKLFPPLVAITFKRGPRIGGFGPDFRPCKPLILFKEKWGFVVSGLSWPKPSEITHPRPFFPTAYFWRHRVLQNF